METGKPETMPVAASLPHRRIPELDGFRGLAVLMVITGHVLEFSNLPDGIIRAGADLDRLGVLLFFVLSGFLITMLLQQERNSVGRINFRGFYARRAFRLGPALILFLLTVITLMRVRLITDVPRYELFASLFYVRNFFGTSQSLAHLWSLSLEEQFYLCWPILFAVFPMRRSLRITIALCAAIAVWRGVAIERGLFNYASGIYYMRPYFRFDSILIGACLAIALSNRSEGLDGARSMGKRLPASALWVALLAWSLVGEAVSKPLYLTIQVILVTALLGRLVLSESGASKRLFSQPALRYVGKISYSLYLWQQLFLVTKQPSWGILREFPVNLLMPFILAMLSYHFMEGPILRLKDRT
jgi:peptidoglycan/LPS O-acetylase OafA/YrhL